MSLERRVKNLEQAKPPQRLVVLSDKEHARLIEEGWTPPENALVVILTSYLTEEVKS